MLDAVLAESGLHRTDITHVAFANGPGAFTGVRIAAATAQGIAIALSIPLIGVSTLAVLAQRVADEQGVDRVQAVIDARMGEAYSGLYQRDEQAVMQRLEKECLLPLAELRFDEQALIAGSALQALEQAGLPRPAGDASALPSAHALLRLARIQANQARAGQDASINYLRNQVAVRKPPTVY